MMNAPLFVDPVRDARVTELEQENTRLKDELDTATREIAALRDNIATSRHVSILGHEQETSNTLAWY
jgi:cell division septum initiation protein DivIVA